MAARSMNLETARANIGQRVTRYWENRPRQHGYITGIWPKRGHVYVRFDGKSNPQAVDPILLELETNPEGTTT